MNDKDKKVQRLELPVDEMTCANCALRVEKALNAVPGVEKAVVNFALHNATVSYNPHLFKMDSALNAVHEAGYRVPTHQTQLNLQGLECAACVNRVERALIQVSGVLKASVNLATQNVLVEYLPNLVKAQDLILAIEKTGYTAQQPQSESEEDWEQQAREKNYRALLSKLVFSVTLTIPIMIGSMASFFPGLRQIPEQLLWIFLFLLTTPILFYAGGQFFFRAFRALKHFSADMNTLISVGTSAAFLYSVVATFFPSWLPSNMRFVYFDTTAVIITLILFGRLLEARAKGRTSEAIKKLIQLQPKTARIIRGDQEIEIPIEQVTVGDVILIRPGEKIPIDGKILQGLTAVDESMITGESLPVQRGVGDELLGGTLNKNGSVQFRATRVGKETALQQIIQMVRQAQGSKAPIQRLADLIASVFVPVVLGIALLTFILWMIWGPEPELTFALLSLINVLIIACPCALGLATPTSIMVGTGKGAENGVLIKNGEALERIHRINTIVLDKTGTITEGRPEVTDILPLSGFTSENILQLAAAVEFGSEHPLGEAIRDLAREQQIKNLPSSDFKSFSGLGVQAKIEEQIVLLGNEKFMQQYQVTLEKNETQIRNLAESGKTPVFIARNNELLGIIAIADPVKSDSKRAIEVLQKMGIEVIMLTGDHLQTAQAIASQVGISQVIAEVRPEEKAWQIRKLQDSGNIVAMVGDGINDAPALAQADVGIAIGTGTDVAIDASDITLVKGSLKSVITAIQLSQATLRNIKQNLFGSFIYNILGIPVAAGLFFPLFEIFLNPMLAAVAMAASSVTVVTNALRLKKFQVKF